MMTARTNQSNMLRTRKKMMTPHTNPSTSARFSTPTPTAAIGVRVEKLAEIDGFVRAVFIFLLGLSKFDRVVRAVIILLLGLSKY